ncbi:hypothetical protein Tco_0599045 [Tanacetum coccineum]
MLKVGYDNGFQIDMYVDHFRYDIMEMVEWDRNEELRNTRIKAELNYSDDDYHYSDDDLEEIENVDFHTEGDDSVVIKNITTQDPFLTKLCSARILFRGHVEFGVNEETPQVDPDDNQIDHVYKIKNGVVYPAFDPDIPWDKMEPILGMRFRSPHQLKMALANYGVAHGYWFIVVEILMMEDVQVRKEINIECCQKKVKTRLFRGDEGNQAVKKPVKKPVKKIPDTQSRDGTSQSPKWTQKHILNSKKVNCPFRLYASWMSRKQSFQIKSLRSEHKCCRNYNLGSLVTYKWIDVQYFKEIIEDPFMPLRKIRDDIGQKFMIDVSVGQCKRAKQLALFDHEGGLIEHYAKLYQYRQAILDSNPSFTCTLDVVEFNNGYVSFKRMYICFKGVKDGWLAGCRKGLIDAVNDWLPEAEHIICTRHIKLLDVNAYDYLIQRNPNSWLRAFFEMDRRCATFENGIFESFNRAILGPRMKPIITMLEEIRLYIMQRILAMNKLALILEDTIAPSIRKRLEILKEKQRMWELSGIPCVHAVAAYIHVGYDLDAGVSHWYSKESWFNAYQFSIKPCASRGGGRSGRGDGNDVSGSGSGVNDASGSGVNAGSASGGRGGGRAGGSGGKGGGRASGSGKRGGGRAGRGSERGGVFPSSSSCGILTAEHEYQLELDEQAFRECMKEQAREQAKIDAEQENSTMKFLSQASIPNPLNNLEYGLWTQLLVLQMLMKHLNRRQVMMDLLWIKGKAKASVEDGPAPEQGISIEDGPAPKKKRGRPPSSVDGIRIHHKNRGRSERIANMKLNKPFQFEKFGTGSTLDKAFDVEE